MSIRQALLIALLLAPLALPACGGDNPGAGGLAQEALPDADAPGDDPEDGPDAGRADEADAAPSQDTPDARDTPDADPPMEDAGTPDADDMSDADEVDEPDADHTPDANMEPDADEPDADEPEPMLDPPPAPEYSNGVCPELVGGSTSDTAVVRGFPSGEDLREFRLLVPERYDGSQPMPVVFAWHWLNASSSSFVREAELESAIEQMGFIAVLPDKRKNSNGDKTYLFDWPFAEPWGIDAELTYFDDLLACVSQQFNVDLRRIYGIGVSAGALWLTHLSTTDRVNHFAAIESLSGGLGEVPFAWRMEYAPQPNKFPAIVLWGGQGDWLGLSFHEASMRYRDALLADGHFVVSCTHDSGHAVPPITPPDPDTTRFISLWRFMLDHPYGQSPGSSPYLETGLPDVFPPWCEIAAP